MLENFVWEFQFKSSIESLSAKRVPFELIALGYAIAIMVAISTKKNSVCLAIWRRLFNHN